MCIIATDFRATERHLPYVSHFCHLLVQDKQTDKRTRKTRNAA